MKKTLIAIVTCVIALSCSKKETTDFVSKNDEEIKNYLADNNLTAEKSSSGLYYIINEPGTGTQPAFTSDVTVAYKGYFTNGNVFDQSSTEGISFNLQQVISGWTEGITYFKEGGSGMLLIPAHLGYGNNYYNGIPGGSVLIFEINLISVN
ncbi:FKBP-type peptidyl-prolyl cis-trans isomerase [Snuella sedimenti]|uniref:Peptidyl-prolyl cis-trans isomerase n=1 Tax=Snuella sedimenti TaxID=2798802 RepID=A0A8J7LNF4_9FLAO|nr:FKBP-type peptidyl-prolyl cis-trans isomerase [Snuella sedimenti]MBJ6367843.1 FKBP-type peptidyl-prolyl cis-trans isomerase [Snuella sedimenti]